MLELHHHTDAKRHLKTPKGKCLKLDCWNWQEKIVLMEMSSYGQSQSERFTARLTFPNGHQLDVYSYAQTMLGLRCTNGYIPESICWMSQRT